MTTTAAHHQPNSTTPSTPAWAEVLAYPAEPFPLSPLPVIAGQLPDRLQGSLYRNGPARLSRGQQQVGHWFDGDGAVLAVHFQPEQVSATYRYIQTAGLQQEAKRGRYQFPNYGMTVPGPFWQSWGKTIKNAANTSVIAFEEKLLALWEGGLPYCLDLQDLATEGEDTLGALKPGMTFSAHPKWEVESQTCLNFGLTFKGSTRGVKPIFHLYRCDAKGRIQQQQQLTLPALSVIHDFVLAGPYAIVMLNPVRLDVWPVFLGFNSFSDSLSWQPELGTQIFIFERDRLSLVAQGSADPWFQWHFSNGAQLEDGSIEIEMVRYPDWHTNQHLQEIPSGRLTTSAPGYLWRLRLDPQTAKVIEQSPCSDRSCEFPVVAPAQIGQPWRFTYCVVHRPGEEWQGELLGEIACYDHQTATLTTTNLGPQQYPSEPIFAPDPQHSDQGWLLSVVYDGRTNNSEVHIYQSDRLDTGPICRLGLPQPIPHSFHGTWRPA